MIPLELISDANLISARQHGVELNVEAICAVLDEAIHAAVSDRQNCSASAAQLPDYERLLRDVIVHAWPAPSDPVVIALRDQAQKGLASLTRLLKA